MFFRKLYMTMTSPLLQEKIDLDKHFFFISFFCFGAMLTFVDFVYYFFYDVSIISLKFHTM